MDCSTQSISHLSLLLFDSLFLVTVLSISRVAMDVLDGWFYTKSCIYTLKNLSHLGKTNGTSVLSVNSFLDNFQFQFQFSGFRLHYSAETLVITTQFTLQAKCCKTKKGCIAMLFKSMETTLRFAFSPNDPGPIDSLCQCK